MQNSIPVALILGVWLIVAAFLAGGRYKEARPWGPGFLSLRPTLTTASKLGLGRRLHHSLTAAGFELIRRNCAVTVTVNHFKVDDVGDRLIS